MAYQDHESPGILLSAGLINRADACIDQQATMRALERHASRSSAVRIELKKILNGDPTCQDEQLRALLKDADQEIFEKDLPIEASPPSSSLPRLRNPDEFFPNPQPSTAIEDVKRKLARNFDKPVTLHDVLGHIPNDDPHTMPRDGDR